MENIIFFILGITVTYIIFIEYKMKILKQRNVFLESQKNEYTKENFKIIENKYKRTKTDLDNIESKYRKLNEDYENIKKYIGLIADYEYGILKETLTETLPHGGIKEYKVRCEFKTILKGLNNVKILIQEVYTEDGNKDTDLFSHISNLLNGWYDIDDKNITWITPDATMRRNIDIDNILE